MRIKTLGLFGTAILLACVFYLSVRDGDEGQIAEELAKQEIRRQRDETAPRKKRDLKKEDPLDLTGVIRLSETLIAEKQTALGDWIVRRNGGAGSLAIPFPPPSNGKVPNGDSGADHTEKVLAANEAGFVGAAVCAECHEENHSGFIHTAHHLTSGVVEKGEIAGDFSEPKNILLTPDPELSFAMKESDDGYVQSIRFSDWELEVPLDVFTGSAKAGRTFLFWRGDGLFQSHVSYLSSVDEWIASPGYEPTKADYTRRIRTACLECHMTYIESKRGSNRYHRESAVWGISCERCHGPGATHVDFHREHPNDKEAHAIVHPKQLSRAQQLDICAQCHSGSFSLLGEAFSYRPGLKLENYHELKNPDFKGVGGIHTSNQLTRLGMSECFKQSEMTCTTCHDPHENQRGDTKAFTAACLACHQSEACGMSDELDEQISDNCVSCHMPLGDNEGMTMRVSDGSFTVSMIDHHIRVDKDATESHLKEAD